MRAPHSDGLRWTVLVPMRSLPGAKSRLAATLPAHLHAEVVRAIRADTLAAVHEAQLVARVLVVGDLAGEGVDLVQTTPGLNGALVDGAAWAVGHWPDDGVAALVADLPALRASELDTALAAAAAAGSAVAFVADDHGTGTTLLTARPGTALLPRFGPDSAARHAQRAVRLDAGPGLRCDVDTADDLVRAARVGLGPVTTAVAGIDGVLHRSP